MARRTAKDWAKEPSQTNTKKTRKKAKAVKPPADEVWGVRMAPDLLVRLRLVCAQRRAKRIHPHRQKEVAEMLIEGWLKKVGG